SQMLDGIKEEAVGFLFNLEVQVEESAPAAPVSTDAVPLPVAETPVEIRAKGLGSTRSTPRALQYSAPSIDGAAGDGGSGQIGQAPALGLGGDGTQERTRRA